MLPEQFADRIAVTDNDSIWIAVGDPVAVRFADCNSVIIEYSVDDILSLGVILCYSNAVGNGV